MDNAPTIALIGVIVGLIAQAVTFSLYLSRVVAQALAQALANDTVLAEREAKARHDLAARVEAIYLELRRDLAAIAVKYEDLAQDAVRRPEHIVFETRLFAGIDKLEGKFEGLAREMRDFMKRNGSD